MYIYTQTFIMKGGNTCGSYSPHFCNWTHGYRWYLKLPSVTHPVFPLSSARVSVGYGSVLGRETQTFILEGSGPLVVRPRIGLV